MRFFKNLPRDSSRNGSGPAIKSSIGIGITSWKSSKTLRVSLESHHKNGLFNIFDDVVVFIQEADTDDVEAVSPFKSRHITFWEEPLNRGVTEGMREAAEMLGTDYMLFLREDTHTVANQKTLEKQLLTAVHNMEQEQSVVRCYLTNDEVVDIAKAHPSRYEKIGEHLLLHTRQIPWLNVGAFFHREWFLEKFLPAIEAENPVWGNFFERHEDAIRAERERAVIEKPECLMLERTMLKREWWRKKDWRIGVINENLFAHHRIEIPPLCGDYAQIHLLPKKR